MAHIRHPEWRDSNEDTNYPFEDDATLANNAGAAIDPTVFLDASLYPVGGIGDYYLSRLVITNTTVTLYIGDPANITLAYTSFAVNDIPDELRLVDTYGRSAGILVSESARLLSLKALGTGTHDFSPSQTPFVAAVCIPMPEQGVSGFLLDDGTVVSGDVWLVGGEGVVLSQGTSTIGGYCQVTQSTFSTIRIDVVGDPLFRRKLCSSPTAFQTPQFIQQICFTTPELTATTGGTTTTVADSADILFLVDTTGSMGGFINTLHSVMPEILEVIRASVPTATLRWAVAGYRDVEDGGSYGSYGFLLHQAFTSNDETTVDTIGGLTAGGGGDEPEQNLMALKNLATNWVASLGGNTTSARAIIWAGDAVGWEDGAKGHTYPSLQATLDALDAANVTVFGLNMRGVDAGINRPGPAPSDGRSQASTIVETTGGDIYHDVNDSLAGDIADAVVDSIIKVVIGDTGKPSVLGQTLCCGPGDYGNISITAGSQDAADTILRVRAAEEGLIIEAVGEKLEDIR